LTVLSLFDNLTEIGYNISRKGGELNPTALLSCPHYSKQVWDQVKSWSRKELLHKISRDSRWERLWGKSGHPTFVNRHLSPPFNTIVVHVDPKRKSATYILKLTLAKLGWTEDYLRTMGYVR